MSKCTRKTKDTTTYTIYCGHTAVKKDNEGNPLCKFHYKEWTSKLYKAGNAYYKGALSTAFHISMLIYVDGINSGRDEETICDTILAHTNLTEYKVIHFLIEIRPPDVEEWLKTRREWASKYITIK